MWHRQRAAARRVALQLSPSGPVSIVLSQGSGRVVVYRNGIEIGRARVTISSDVPIPSHALVLTEGPSSTPDPYVPDATKYRWVRLGVAGHMQEAGTQVDPRRSPGSSSRPSLSVRSIRS